MKITRRSFVALAALAPLAAAPGAAAALEFAGATEAPVRDPAVGDLFLNTSTGLVSIRVQTCWIDLGTLDGAPIRPGVSAPV